MRPGSVAVWSLCGLALVIAAVMGWFATSVSATGLSSSRSDGSDLAIFSAIYLLPAGAVVAGLVCRPLWPSRLVGALADRERPSGC